MEGETADPKIPKVERVQESRYNLKIAQSYRQISTSRQLLLLVWELPDAVLHGPSSTFNIKWITPTNLLHNSIHRSR